MKDNISPCVCSSITNKRALIIILVDFILFFALYFYLPFEKNVNFGLSLLLFIGILWFSEAIHVTVTALFIPVLAVIFDIYNVEEALKSFSNPIIFLFLGGFALATALHVQGLDKFIANKLISLSRGSICMAIIMLFISTSFLSMWISNTATAAIMLPLGLGILSGLDFAKYRNTFVFVLLGIAYSASIGGFGTIIGSPPNAIASSTLKLDFISWMKLGIPFMLVMLPSCTFVMYLLLRPKFNFQLNLKLEDIKWNHGKTITTIIFVSIALAWIFSTKISYLMGGVKNIDSIIALLAILIVCVSGVVSFGDIQKNTDWGILLLFGGGLSLSNILQTSGASLVMANAISNLVGDANWILIVLMVALFIIFLTEFTSNTASAALLIPIFSTISQAVGMSETLLTLIIGFGASCAFMLPVATPPNAMVFGTGFIKQKDMIRVGFLLNLISVFLIVCFALFVWRFI